MCKGYWLTGPLLYVSDPRVEPLDSLSHNSCDSPAFVVRAGNQCIFIVIKLPFIQTLEFSLLFIKTCVTLSVSSLLFFNYISLVILSLVGTRNLTLILSKINFFFPSLAVSLHLQWDNTVTLLVTLMTPRLF